jgi:hypothetical protein
MEKFFTRLKTKEVKVIVNNNPALKSEEIQDSQAVKFFLGKFLEKIGIILLQILLWITLHYLLF